MAENTPKMPQTPEELTNFVANVTIEAKTKNFDAATRDMNAFEKSALTLQTSVKALLSPMKSLAAVVGAGWGFQKGIDTVLDYSKGMTTLSAQMIKYGVSITQVEGKIEGLSKQLSLTRAETMRLMSSFEKAFPTTTLSGAEKILKNITNTVGSQADAIAEMQGNLAQLANQYPGLQASMENLSELDKQRLSNQINFMVQTGKMSLQQAKALGDYLSQNNQVGEENKKRLEEEKGHIKAVKDLQRQFEGVALQLGGPLLKLMGSFGNWLKDHEETVKNIANFIGKWGPSIVIAVTALKAIETVKGIGAIFSGAKGGAGGKGVTGAGAAGVGAGCNPICPSSVKDLTNTLGGSQGQLFKDKTAIDATKKAELAQLSPTSARMKAYNIGATVLKGAMIAGASFAGAEFGKGAGESIGERLGGEEGKKAGGYLGSIGGGAAAGGLVAGPVGAAIGAVVGLGSKIFQDISESDEKQKKSFEEAAKKAQEQKDKAISDFGGGKISGNTYKLELARSGAIAQANNLREAAGTSAEDKDYSNFRRHNPGKKYKGYTAQAAEQDQLAAELSVKIADSRKADEVGDIEEQIKLEQKKYGISKKNEGELLRDKEIAMQRISSIDQSIEELAKNKIKGKTGKEISEMDPEERNRQIEDIATSEYINKLIKEKNNVGKEGLSIFTEQTQRSNQLKLDLDSQNTLIDGIKTSMESITSRYLVTGDKSVMIAEQTENIALSTETWKKQLGNIDKFIDKNKTNIEFNSKQRTKENADLVELEKRREDISNESGNSADKLKRLENINKEIFTVTQQISGTDQIINGLLAENVNLEAKKRASLESQLKLHFSTYDTLQKEYGILSGLSGAYENLGAAKIEEMQIKGIIDPAMTQKLIDQTQNSYKEQYKAAGEAVKAGIEALSNIKNSKLARKNEKGEIVIDEEGFKEATAAMKMTEERAARFKENLKKGMSWQKAIETEIINTEASQAGIEKKMQATSLWAATIYDTEKKIRQQKADIMGQQIALVDSMGMGLGASVQARQQQMEQLNLTIETNRKQQEAAKLQLQGATTDDERKNIESQILTYKSEELSLMQKQVEASKALREGWISAMQSSQVATGRITKIMVNQQQNLAAGLKNMQVISNVSGSIMGGVGGTTSGKWQAGMNGGLNVVGGENFYETQAGPGAAQMMRRMKTTREDILRIGQESAAQQQAGSNIGPAHAGGLNVSPYTAGTAGGGTQTFTTSKTANGGTVLNLSINVNSKEEVIKFVMDALSKLGSH